MVLFKPCDLLALWPVEVRTMVGPLSVDVLSRFVWELLLEGQLGEYATPFPVQFAGNGSCRKT